MNADLPCTLLSSLRKQPSEAFGVLTLRVEPQNAVGRLFKHVDTVLVIGVLDVAPGTPSLYSVSSSLNTQLRKNCCSFAEKRCTVVRRAF